MPDPEEPRPIAERGEIERLGRRLDAFDAERAPAPKLGGRLGIGESAADGYRLLGQMLGGVLGGLGLGWLVDRFAHTGPWGVVIGLVVGATLSIVATVKTASAISARAGSSPSTPAAAAARLDDEED